MAAESRDELFRTRIEPHRRAITLHCYRMLGSLQDGEEIAQESLVVHVDDAAERAKRQIGRPSTVANFQKQVAEILQQTADLASLEILRRVRETGYQGGKTALYALVASLRPKSAKPLVRFEGLPGEFSQHDFGQVEVEFLNGARQRIHFFASRLKYSRLVRISLVKDETAESLVRFRGSLKPYTYYIYKIKRKVKGKNTMRICSLSVPRLKDEWNQTVWSVNNLRCGTAGSKRPGLGLGMGPGIFRS